MVHSPSSSPAKSSQLMSNHSYEITHYRDTYLKTVSMHSHDFFELYFFVSGDAGYIIENLHISCNRRLMLIITAKSAPVGYKRHESFLRAYGAMAESPLR